MTRLRVQGIVGVLALAAMSGAAAEKEYVCGAGVEVRLSAPIVAPGGVVVVVVRSEQALESLRAEWKGKPLQFWSGAENAVQRALLGVDLGQSPGVATLKLTAATAGAPAKGCRVPVRVKKVDYGVERLRVARRFIELTPEDEARAEREAKRLQEIFAGVTPERLWSGAFRSPVEGVKPSGNFGRRRFLNGQPRSPHSGEDFPAKLGAPVVAAQRGRVVLAEDFFYSGSTVVLDHGLGLYTFYAHL
ncbi:MAG TPA: M23 family metallopeptidase, partial [Candidatus Acidoferrales bacterium]|nr:M23 family metallopeptidase [Candidatus Acidoferrales bacterium]